jgi:hypothetical protein
MRRRRQFVWNSWVGLISRRLAVMPGQATLEEEAELLSALSVGAAAIALLEARPYLSAGATLDRAFIDLSDANVAAARDGFARFCTQESHVAGVETQHGKDAAVQAALIHDALRRHPQFFARMD